MRLFAAVLFAWLLALSVTSQPQPVPSGFGVAIAWQRGDAWADRSLELLDPPLYMDWVYNPVRMATDDRYYPMAFSLRPAAMRGYIDAAADMSGRFWLLGNEPDALGTYTDPVPAAEAVRLWQREIGGQYACCGVMLWTWDSWRTWSDAYLDAGGPIPPYWMIHVYGGYSGAGTGKSFPGALAEFEAWAASRDATRPIVVSETAVPWGTVADNMAWMDSVAAALVDDPLLMAAIWYSDNDWFQDLNGDSLWRMTDLMTEDQSRLYPLGEHYLSLQPGGANDPAATATPEPEPAQEQKPTVWLPSVKKGG